MNNLLLLNSKLYLLCFKIIDWKTDWKSELHIVAQTDLVETRTEFYTFELSDLISSVGGYLGKGRVQIKKKDGIFHLSIETVLPRYF